MKKIFLIIYLILFNIGYSQNKSGEVTYKVIFGENMSGNVYKEAARNSADKLEYSLKFKDSLSLFTQINKIDNDDLAVGLASAFSGYKNPVYFNKKSGVYKYHNTNSPIFDNQEYLINYKDTIGWVLTKETKVINNYTCYKATTLRPSYKLNETSYFPVTAWYCPKIAFPYGPLDCAGLPGLIFELQYQYGSIVLDKIDFSKDIDFLQPKKGENITEKDFNKLFNSRMKEASDTLKN